MYSVLTIRNFQDIFMNLDVSLLIPPAASSENMQQQKQGKKGQISSFSLKIVGSRGKNCESRLSGQKKDFAHRGIFPTSSLPLGTSWIPACNIPDCHLYLCLGSFGVRPPTSAMYFTMGADWFRHSPSISNRGSWAKKSFPSEKQSRITQWTMKRFWMPLKTSVMFFHW